MNEVPTQVRYEVIRRLYQDMDRLRWDELSNREKSDAYRQFLSDPQIGGRLAPFLSSERTRVWIKDGPAKEYGRALEGVGPYAAFTTRMYSGLERLLAQVLGPEWRVREGTLDDKPMRCWAETDDGSTRYVIWGAASGLKDLVWHTVAHRTEHWDSEPIVVITTRGAAPLSESTRRQAERMCEIVGAELREAPRAVVNKRQDP